MAQESNQTYPFDPGAVSRNLGGEMIEEWRVGKARTVSTPLTGRALVPGMEGWQNFAAVQGQNPSNPKEIYMEWKFSRTAILALANPVFRVELQNIPTSCQLIYWRTGYLDTRGNSAGENEVMRSVQSGSPGFNLNFALACGPTA